MEPTVGKLRRDRHGAAGDGSGEFSLMYLTEAEGVSGIQLGVVVVIVNLHGLLYGLESPRRHVSGCVFEGVSRPL